MIGAWAIVASELLPVDHVPDDLCAGTEGAGREHQAGAGRFLVMAIVGGAFFPLLLGWIARSTGSMALGYLVPLFCFAGVGLYGFVAPLILPPPGMTDPEAGLMAAERGYGI